MEWRRLFTVMFGWFAWLSHKDDYVVKETKKNQEESFRSSSDIPQFPYSLPSTEFKHLSHQFKKAFILLEFFALQFISPFTKSFFLLSCHLPTVLSCEYILLRPTFRLWTASRRRSGVVWLFSCASTCLSSSRLPRAFPPFHYVTFTLAKVIEGTRLCHQFS